MSPSDITVLFKALPISLKVSNRDQQSLIRFASALSLEVASARPFTCLVTSSKALRKLNCQFLGHDYATDVLSFPFPDSAVGLFPESHIGDLAISIERANTQAQEFGHTTLEELQILMLHGLLHLVGFDHETDRGQMARAERKWRRHFGMPANLIARSRAGLAS